MATTLVDHREVPPNRPHEPSRSPDWPRVERAHIVEQPDCICCKPGTTTKTGVQVHHKFPFHYCVALGRPDLELDDRNLITLCENEPGKLGENHHLLVGHLDNFKSSNLEVVRDASVTFFGMTAAEIRASGYWKAKVQARLTLLGAMDEREKAAFAKLMNHTFPKR